MTNYLTKDSLSSCLEKVLDYRGKTPKKLGSNWSKSGYRAISANNVKHDGLHKSDDIKFVDENLYKKWMKDEIKKGDIILTSEAPAGQVMVWDSDEKIVLSQRLFGLRVNAKVDNWFLKYYLQSETGQKEIFRNNSGSTVSGISVKTFNNIVIRFPDKLNQTLTGNVLKILDKKIELNNRINNKLELVSKTLYDNWFVQYDFPDKNGKPYKSNGGKMIWNKKLKINIPYDWNVIDLESQINFNRGISYTSQDIESSKGIPMINLASIDVNRNYRPNELKYYSGEYSSNKLVSQGDLLIACTDLTQNADIIGSPIIVPNESSKYLYSMDLAKVNILVKDISDIYLYMTLRTDFYHKYIKYFASGTNVLHLNLDGILWYPIIKSPYELQSKFANIVRPFIRKQAEILNENAYLSRLRDWLLPMLMNGQVKFTN